MRFTGSATIRAPRQKVWDFVIDPAQVGQCGPGVESIEKVDDRHYRAVAKVGIGFVSARFKGTLEIVDEEAPARAVLKASGQAPGSAADALTTINLDKGDEPDTTVMGWTADVTISGTLASVGARLIEGTTNKLIGQTFDCVKAKLET